MSTKIGIIAEGVIDHLLLPPLLGRIAADKAQFSWPVDPEDLGELLVMRKRGHGGVLETVRKLVQVLETGSYDHALFVILLDRRTRPVQDKIHKLIRGKDRFVLGIAIEEIEAWWLGDRRCTLAWAALQEALPRQCRYAVKSYMAERDPDPKKTLDELTRVSDRFDRFYGDGNTELAVEFAEDYWRNGARLDDIAQQCPKGFGRFQRRVTKGLRRVKERSGRLF